MLHEQLGHDFVEQVSPREVGVELLRIVLGGQRLKEEEGEVRVRWHEKRMTRRMTRRRWGGPGGKGEVGWQDDDDEKEEDKEEEHAV